jgi:drug efflux transport system ATP-binding protein
VDSIVFDRVTRRYGSTVAVRDLSLSVGKGEMFGLIGPDGAGKTTTIRLICGLLAPDAGTLRVHGLDPVRDHRALTSSVGYLSQRFSLYGDLTVDENIAFFAEIHNVHDYRTRRDRLLALTQLTPFRTRLADRLSRGITIVMATPYLDEAERCSRVALIHTGGLLALERPDALRRSLSGALFEIVVDDHRRATTLLKSLPLVDDVSMFGERAHVRVARPDASTSGTLRSTLEQAGFRVHDIRPIGASLEDVFIAKLHEVTS